MTDVDDFIEWEAEWNGHAIERLRDNRRWLAGAGRWGGERDDLLSIYELAAMAPVMWWW